MKRSFFVISMCCFQCIVFAQTNYKAGYVINLKGDTLHGFVNLKEWDSNPTDIYFKTDASDSKVEKLSAKDISRFVINGYEDYRAYNVKISLATVDERKASFKIDTTFKTDTVFLKVLATGKHVTLFKYSDLIKNRFYFLDSTLVNPEEFNYSVYNDTVNMVTYVDTKVKYETKGFYRQIGTLAYRYHFDINKTTNGAFIEYKEQDLIKFINALNRVDASQSIKSPAVHYPIRSFIGLAEDFNTFQYAGSSPFPHNFPVKYQSPEFLFGVDVFMNPNVGRTFFRFDMRLSYGSFDIKDSSFPNNVLVKYDYYAQYLKQINASIEVLAVYNIYNKKMFKFFVGGGLNISYYKYTTNYFETDADNALLYAVNNYPEMQSFLTTVVVKSGFEIDRRIALYASYQPTITTVLKDYVGMSASLKTWSVGVNYLFGKTK